jgi:predicted DCC family thiol-disulfide oxidoreductase YuxK
MAALKLHYDNQWTGAQYSCLRFMLASLLFIHFVVLIPWAGECFSNSGALPQGALSPLFHAFPNMFIVNDDTLFIQIVLGVACLLSLCLAVGWHDKIAAVLLWYILACLFGRNPLINNPSIPFVAFLLLVHACIPGSPYWSIHARKAIDPRNGWFFPPALFACLWVVMAVGYSYSGYYKLFSQSWLDGSALLHVLHNPLSRDSVVVDLLLGVPPVLLQIMTWSVLVLELAFLPLVLFSKTRCWAWLAMLAMHFGILLTVSFAELSIGMILLHAFTFDPRWMRSNFYGKPFSIFYDGSCGLCHHTVRLVIAESCDHESTCFSPLHSDYFRETLSPQQQQGLPDSIVVIDHNNALLVKSAAILYIYNRLGSYWRALAVLFAFIPQCVRDVIYDQVAKIRKRIFASPKEACPLLPAELQRLFRN